MRFEKDLKKLTNKENRSCYPAMKKRNPANIKQRFLMGIAEDMVDNATVDKRLEHLEFFSESEMRKYLKKRQKKR